MGGELGVTPDDLRELSNRHQQIAGDIASAGQATDGTSMKVGLTHGLVCGLTIAAVEAAQQSRSAAAQRMQSASHDLATKLGSAASNYTATDRHQGSSLDDQMHPR